MTNDEVYFLNHALEVMVSAPPTILFFMKQIS